jgi:hypothetical protein
MEFNLFTASPLITEKIKRLYNLLKKEKNEYEQLAANIPDKELKRTVLGLAQEHNQYANELMAQAQTLGCEFHENYNDKEEPEKATEIFSDDCDVLSFCKTHEKKLVSAYREILNETFLYDGLSKIFRYQLNGILCAFTQLKLLYSLKSNPVQKSKSFVY